MRLFHRVDPLTSAVIKSCSPARFVRLQQGQLASGRPSLLVADLSESVVLLGRYQRRWSAAGDWASVVRRVGGGRALRIHPGVTGVSLVVPDPQFPPDKTMNRCVRGLLSAIGSVSGKAAHYFGRDAAVVGGNEVALLSQEGLGPVLFEAYVSVTGALEMPAGRYPGHGDPRVAAPPRAMLAGGVTFDVLSEALVRAYGARPGALPDEGADLAVDEDEAGLAWSGWADVPIGFIEALTGPGTVRLRGDFIAASATIAALERLLATESRARVRRTVAEAFEGGYLIGVDAPETLADAVLAAG